MKKQSLSIVIATVLGFALVPGAFAQPANSTLYQPNVDLTTLSQNGFNGIVGGIFYTPYYYNVNVNYLGYADPNDAPLAISHTITIWSDGGQSGSSGGVVASAVMPSGTPTLWANGYAWVPISTVTLSYQSYYEVGATVVGGVDSWGDLIQNNNPDPGNNGQITWNAVNGSWGGDPNSPFVQAGSGWEFTRDGIYDGNTSDAGNPNPSLSQSGANDSIYPAPNVGYNIVGVPEPGSLTLLGLGAALLFGRWSKQKN